MEWNAPPKTPEQMRREERKKLLDEAVNMILSDPLAPPHLKLALQGGETAQRISTKMHGELREVMLSLKPECTAADIARGKALLEYLLLMEAGLDSFLASFHGE